MIIYNRRGRGAFGKVEREKIKRELVKLRYPHLEGKDLSGYSVSHKIPFLISQSNDFDNLELISNEEYRLKKWVNHHVMARMRKENIIEQITKFVDEIANPEEAKLIFKKYYDEKLSSLKPEEVEKLKANFRKDQNYNPYHTT